MIKILCTTVGETVADYLNETLGLGLTDTTLVMSALLVVVLVFQFRAPRYVPGIYWLAVVLISVVGTLITDNLIDNLGVPLVTTHDRVRGRCSRSPSPPGTPASARCRSTPSSPRRREAFYWLAILFTFALGTAAGDLVAEQFGLGYWPTAADRRRPHRRDRGRAPVFRAQRGARVLGRLHPDPPAGRVDRRRLSQARADGGLGLGTTVTSVIFLVVILALVIYLAVTRRDQTQVPVHEEDLVAQS